MEENIDTETAVKAGLCWGSGLCGRSPEALTSSPLLPARLLPVALRAALLRGRRAGAGAPCGAGPAREGREKVSLGSELFARK